ncbi:hypothetical protein [[Leptolyngbya] sp. PCC 7376]|nr:hypothetical protein [[Leptolyngbya] sp. PCC 7376]
MHEVKPTNHLRNSEQRYATLATAAPVGIFRTNAAGHCIAGKEWVKTE